MKLTILVVNYNSAHHFLELLDSLRKSSFKDFEIIVVENASTDNSLEILESLNNITLIKNPKNTGFTGGANLGIKNIKTKYTLILNPDVIVEKDTIRNLLDFAEKNNADFVGGSIYDYETKEHYSSGGMMNPITGIAKSVFYSESRELKEFEFVDACSLLVKTDSFKSLMYDEDYFMYVETFDLTTRARKNGMKVYANPSAKVYHKLYGSFHGKKSPLAIYYLIRNRFLFIKKNYPDKYKKFLIFQPIIFLIQSIKHPKLIPSIIKGYIRGISQK